VPGSAGGAVRLADGAWALVDAAGVWFGVLDGDVASGWRVAVGVLHRADVPALRRVLTGGGLVTGAAVSVAADGQSAVLDVADGPAVLLGAAATARLQVLCSRRPGPSAAPAAGAVAGAAGLAVRASRAALEVDVPDGGRAGSAIAGLSVAAPGIVHVGLDGLDDAPAPDPLPLPALPLLLAAAEADRDDDAVELRLRQPDGMVLAGVVDAADAVRVAADAQWLLPSLLRRAAQSTAPR
jgi:hypothetical protein